MLSSAAGRSMSRCSTSVCVLGVETYIPFRSVQAPIIRACMRRIVGVLFPPGKSRFAIISKTLKKNLESLSASRRSVLKFRGKCTFCNEEFYPGSSADCRG